MFTGIIESQGIIKDMQTTGTNQSFWIESPISSQFKIDQSICHNGICLTIEHVRNNTHKVTAIQETLSKSNLGMSKVGDILNLERSMVMSGRIEGHIVQGHVDTTGICIERKELNGSLEFGFDFPTQFSNLIIEKGSICLNGMSLTIFKIGFHEFSVAIVPYTVENTNISKIEVGSKVNLEFDMFGKYICRFMEVREEFNKN